MSRSDQEATRVVRLWLEEGATALPDRVLDDVLDQLSATPQRRPAWLAWRSPFMSNFVRIALAAAAVVVVALIGYQFLFSPTSPAPGSGPSPTPVVSPTSEPSSLAPSASPSPPLDTSAWTTFESDRYGFSIAHPADWTEQPSDHDWTLEADAAWPNTAADKFTAPDGNIALAAWSLPVDQGKTLEEWIQAYCPANTTPCTGIQERAVPIYAEVRDQHPGLLVSFKDDIQAFFLNAGRIYVVASWRPAEEFDSERLIEAFALSMCLGSPEAPCSAP
jgi:hypothetical protein